MSLLEAGILAKYTCFFCYTAQNCVILQHQILKQYSMKLKRRILHNLSKVTRTVNAQGRIESYSNVLPSYFMAHVICKLNIKPKKK